ncbi:PepSY domain-containing protein [Sediminicola luteus]|uniref:Peptidase n=1 Tax=Sediminicola luteus TaxID=319238 RepID=A0A2A4G4A9_9FLAO|nr:PepSY domain-containing protein [Sediminicola luteus]PCE62810.1 hypothetical protein B7P33_16135 [Sediminicola luteus]
MKKRVWVKRTRKWHRYLGFVLGIQFLLWTIGGLYFSWTNIETIRGSDLRNPEAVVAIKDSMLSPSIVAESIGVDSVRSIELRSVLGEPFYELSFSEKGIESVALVHALTGQKRKPLSKSEAEQMAMRSLNVKAPILKTELIQESGKHHEYRNKPLPAFAVSFGAPAQTTIYISQNDARVRNFRNDQWRAFDFLWMLHTMDYAGRDDFNNFVLRLFSIFGLITLGSGFLLYGLTSKQLQKKPRGKKK